MKKLFALVLSLVLVLSIFSGCTKKEATNTGEGTTEATTEGGTTEGGASTEEPMDLSVMIWDRANTPAGYTIEDNTLVTWLKERALEELNVNLTFVAVPRSGSDDKVNVMMAGGTAPDIILSYSTGMFGNFAVNGGLTDLTALVDEYGPMLKEQLSSFLEIGQVDGVQYAIPAKRNLQKTKHIGYIRKDWLDILGMEVPTTKEELNAVLYAFKEKNPGNVENLIPWAMGGNQETEKYFLNYVGSFVDISNEKDQFMYMKNFKAIAPGAVDGFRELNKLYNDGIISTDFAVDTNDDKYRQDIAIGNVGFFVDDNFRPIDGSWLATLKANVPTAEFIPINAFESPDGTYVNPADPLYGAYIMVPSASEDRAVAAVKYLNWLADPENAIKVRYTPEVVLDENGIPLSVPEEEYAAKGYPATRADFNIVNALFKYDTTKEGAVANFMSSFPGYDKEYFDLVYDAVTSGLYTEPTISSVLESETNYMSNLEKLIIQYAYTVTSVPTSEFDATQADLYQRMLDAGLQEIIDERAAYYDEKVAK